MTASPQKIIVIFVSATLLLMFAVLVLMFGR